jgi:putative spermidine/putrescine transport system permease protein
MIRRAPAWLWPALAGAARGALRVALASLLLLPLAVLILLSSSKHWYWPALLPGEFQGRQWLSLIADTRGLQGIVLRSAGLGLGVAVLATSLGFVTSRSVARHGRGSLMAMLHLPFALSPVVVGVSLLYLFLRLHLAGHLAGVMLAQLIFAYAYAAILLAGFWTAEVQSLAEVALALGARRHELWRRVLAPLARPSLLVCLFQTFLISWFDYPLTLLIGEHRVTTLTVSLYQYFSSGDTRLAATCGLILLMPPLVVLTVHRQLLSASIATPEGGRR